MIKTCEIRQQLLAYLTGELSLDAFEEWFSGYSWNASSSSPDVQALVYGIEDALSQYSGEALRAELRPFVEDYSVEVIIGNPKMEARIISSNSQPITPMQCITVVLSDSRAAVGTQYEVVSL